MPRTLHQLTIFVSGPGTVEAEKAALRVVVEEINRRCEKTHGVTLRVVGWPDDIRPGVSAELQAEIDHQIGHNFDIYVGILGSRFGTPTPRSGSGTEQEFDKALSRFQRDSTAIRLLFYFKRDPEDPFSIDPNQLRKVLEFRQSLGDRGLLYRDFKDTAEFTKLVREHLDGLIIDEWRDGRWAEAVAALPITDAGSPSVPIQPAVSIKDRVLADPSCAEQEDEELGVLEYMAASHEAAEKIVAVMTAISQETARIGDEIRARSLEADRITEELQKQKPVGGSRVQPPFLAQVRTIVDHAADNLDDFTGSMSPNVDQFKVQNRAMFDNIRRAFQTSVELGPRDNMEDREALDKLIPILDQTRGHVMEFQASINRIPAWTGRFKRSRRRAAAVLGELVAEMSFSIQEARTLLDEMGGPLSQSLA